MPHNLREKHNSITQKLLYQYALEHLLPLSNHDREPKIHNGHHNNNHIPFYDDSNHVAYGWQQMGTLPGFTGLHKLVQDTQDKFSRYPKDRLEKRPADGYQQAAKSVKPDGFDPYPRCGQELSYTPFLTNLKNSSVQHYADTSNSKPPIDSILTGSEGVGNECTNNRRYLALIPKYVNQRLGMGQLQKILSAPSDQPMK